MKIFIILSILLTSIFTPVSSLADIIDDSARQYKIPVDVVRSLVWIESNNRSWISSHDGSEGLTQIQLPTARGLGFRGTRKELRDPKVNLQYGVQYLNQLINKYQDVLVALDAYNRGPGNVKKHPYHGDWYKHPYVGKFLVTYQNQPYLGKPIYVLSSK